MTTNVRFLLVDGVWQQVSESIDPRKANFVIVCALGDWSGFRTLADCLVQIPGTWAQRPPGFYYIEER